MAYISQRCGSGLLGQCLGTDLGFRGLGFLGLESFMGFRFRVQALNLGLRGEGFRFIG